MPFEAFLKILSASGVVGIIGALKDVYCPHVIKVNTLGSMTNLFFGGYFIESPA